MALNKRLALKYIRTKLTFLSRLSKRKAAEEAFTLFCTPQYRNKKEPSAIFSKAEVINFTFQDYQIVGYRWNSQGHKKVLILHGFESSIVNFDRYIQPLIDKDFCVLGFDGPAHGRSSGKTVNVLIYKQFIETINQLYGPIDCFIAHSLGGLALSLVLEEWKNSEAVKAAIIAPATETKTAIDFLFSLLKLDRGVRTEFDKLIREKSGNPAEWFSITRAAKNIRAQVLWLHDEDDDMTPLKDSEPVRKANYPNFRFHITKGLGHRRIYRDNAVAQTIIDFLSDK